MTTANVLDVISRLLGCAAQASDAVSAYTQVKMEDAPKLLGLPEEECLDSSSTVPVSKVVGQKIKTLFYRMKETCMDTH